MTTVELIEELEANGVELWVEGERLRYRGEKEFLSPEVLSKLRDGKAEVLSLQRDRTRRSTLSPVSHGQSALWVLHQVAPASAAYHVGFAAKVQSRIDNSAMQRAIEKLTAHHASLRTTFPTRNGSPVREIHARLPPVFEVLQAGQLTPPELARQVAETYRRPFNLETGPLFRVHVFSRSEEDHLLLLTVHHAVCDGWSLWLLLEELGTLYLAEVNGTLVTLSPLVSTYSDYVRWQRELLRGPRGEALWAYWKKQLGDELPVLDLPTDRPRPAVQNFNGGTLRFRLTPDLTAKVKAFAAAEGTTLYMVLLAAYEVLLHRYAGQDEIILGSPTSGRTQRQFSGVIGDFINTVVLRSSCAGDPSFRAFLTRVGETTLEAIAHEDFPFYLVVERLRVRRDSDRSPLFQVLFNFLKPQSFPEVSELWVGHDSGANIKWGGLALRPFTLAQQEGQVDLSLEMVEGRISLYGILKYNTDLWDEATIVRMAGHYETLLEGIIANPDGRLSELPLLTAHERDQLLVEWNETPADYPQQFCLHELIGQQATRTPAAPAVSFAGATLSYRELDRRANQLAHWLRRAGVGPDVLVGVCGERSLELVVALLGVLKAGGAYVPFDPAYPPERLAFMASDADAPVLLTQEKFLGAFDRTAGAAGQAGPRILRLDTQWPEVAREPDSAPASGVSPDHLAYMIYTSGSTGRPKGALITHRSIVNRLLWMQDAYRLTPADAVVQKTPFSFDVSVWEFFWPLLAGARLVVARPGGHQDAAYLAALVADERVTTMHFVPSMLQAFVEEPGLARCQALRQVFCSGEALPFALQERFFARHGAELHNLYGPTEAAVDVTAWRCERGGARAIVPIGRPIARTQLYVLDGRMQPVPVGVAGELYLGGIGLARGYHRRPELTAEKFVADSFGPPGARLYRTGDLVRWLPDGVVEYLGRLDHQIKLRGFRIELGEIESALVRHPGVREAVVVVWEARGEKALAAYIVPANGVPPPAGELRQALLASLPEYMVPGDFVVLSELPLSPNGKIDRKALPKPTRERLSPPGPFSVTRTPIQRSLTAIWSELLGLANVDLDDNLIHLGGHSLTAVRLVSMIQQRLAAKLAVKDVFAHPTIRELSALIEAQTAGQPAPPDLSPARAPDGNATFENPQSFIAEILTRLKEQKAEIIALQRTQAQPSTLYPVSYGQSALWFLHQLAPDSAAYNVGIAARVRSRVDAGAFQRALENLVSRHASLRTTFASRNDSPVQEIHAALAPAFEVIQSGSLNQQKLICQVADTYRRPFDLERGPLLRAHLFTSGEVDHVLLLTLHHMICDGWSVWLLFEELGALYLEETDGTAPNLPPLTTSYADYVRWQRTFLQGADGERLWTYWKGVLGGELPVLNLPTDRVRPAVQTFQGASFGFHPGPSLTAQLRAFAAVEGSTVFMVLLAAFKVLLHRYTGQEEIVIGSPTSGRTQEQFSGVVGDFINTVVLRSSCAGDPSFRDFLGRIRQLTLEAVAHEEFPFGLLVERLSPGRRSDSSPLFQVLFNFQKPQNFSQAIDLWVANEPGSSLPWGGLSLGPFPLSQQEGQADLTLEIFDGKATLFGILKYNTDLFDEATIARMAGHYETLLHGIAENPNSRLSELPLLTAPEQHQLLAEWNDTQMDFPRDQCLFQLFEAQVARTPQAIAAICADRSLSYFELNSQADELAARLKALRVGPGVLVGLCVERSLAMLVGLIGILKAGGAYLPLDPDHPQPRVESILLDSGIELMVTQKTVLAKLRLDGALTDGAVPPAGNSGGTADCSILRLARCRSLGDAKSYSDPGRRVTPDDLAYVIYTSGSTGRPKGVQLCHRAVVNFLTSMSREPGFTAQDTILALTTVTFDIAALELFLPITVGGRVVIAPRETVIDPESLAGLIRSSGATIVQATPATWRMLVDSGWQGGSELKLLVGGEALPPGLAGQLLGRCASLWNMYGPTETTIWSAISRVDSAHRVSIGRPIANTTLYVLQRGSQLAPIGVPGELYIGGEGLARGYWNRPDLTEQAFVRSPFDPENRLKLYKTGDMVRRRVDGSLEFLGRVDHQVKIRGFRVELGEVEATLLDHPGVKDVVVVVWEDAYADKRLAAYIIAAGAAAVPAGELRSHLAAKLPEYMVPSAFIAVEAFPLTASGKIDRKALPKPARERPSPPGASSVPQTPTQRSLTAIWSELLGLANVELDDNLFHLGAHSLTAVRLVSVIRQRLAAKLAVIDVFAHPTIRELSAIIEARTAEQPSPPVVSLARAPDVNVTFETPQTGGPADRSYLERLVFGSESIFRGPINRILQLAARVAPDPLRCVFHRWRGVRLGTGISIGYDSIIETSYPWLVSIGANSAIGMRVTIIGHFLGMESSKRKQKGITVEIGNNVWIGPGSLILPNVVIGNGSVVAAGSVVSRSVPPGVMVQGNPAIPVARCPIPIKLGMPFEEFVKHLQPLDTSRESQAGRTLRE